MTAFPKGGRRIKPRTLAYRALTKMGRERGLKRSMVRKAIAMRRAGKMATPRG